MATLDKSKLETRDKKLKNQISQVEFSTKLTERQK